MIAHIAQADEQRGRVVLWLGPTGETQDTALDAALRLAHAFDSEIECLFIEDRRLFDLAALPFAREISLSGRRSRAMSPEALARDMQAHAAALQRRVLARARVADVKAQARVVRAEPAQALAEVCAENGPWNVVTVGGAVRNGTATGHMGAGLAELFQSVHATTGIVVAGPQAQHACGPVIAVVEELDRVVPMLRAAERIATATGGDARLWLLEHDQARQDWIEGQIRLALGNYPGINFDVLDMSVHTPRSIAQMMRRAGAGFVITRFGGTLTPREQDVAPFAEMLEGPLFLVR
ncbi:hypothetical protein [Hyphomicrobium sp.]|uniref:hypothetical protein n=1 Tax=Hyphomicrobium sp. TaxID=82 RepID=UPI0025BAD770|nr:hypothetical protein [Hyphomicrobium sp.]MCC7252791.1 universal stress protein [Hyphomicrobium sp.]